MSTLQRGPIKRRSGFSAELVGKGILGESYEENLKSKKMKDFHGDKALAMISERIRKQAQDQFGNVAHFIDHQPIKQDYDGQLFGKMKDGLASVDEEDADEEDEFDWV